MSKEEIKAKEEKEEAQAIDEEVKAALKDIPDLEEEEIEEGVVTHAFEEGVDKQEDIPEGQESDYGI